MITGKDIKKLREEHGLTQLQLGRAIFAEESTISNYESGRRSLKIDTLESIANVFGYTVDFNLIRKEGTSKDNNFYKDKSFKEIMDMSKEDLTDYIFTTQNNEILAKICDIDKVIINSLELHTLKDLLKQFIINTRNDIVYFILNNLHNNVEIDIALLIDEVNDFLYDLNSNGDLDDDTLNKACYIDFDLYGDIYRGELCSDCMRLLDKDKNDLGISHDLLMYDSENPLFYNAQSYELLEYIRENPILKLKY